MKPSPGVAAQDREREAAAELRARARSVRLRSAATCLLAPLLAAYPGYFLVQTLQSRLHGGVASPLVSALLGVVAPLALGLRATAKLTRRLLLRARDPWLTELATTHRVPRQDLVKYTTSWRA